jgi:hypothetical protein
MNAMFSTSTSSGGSNTNRAGHHEYDYDDDDDEGHHHGGSGSGGISGSGRGGGGVSGSGGGSGGSGSSALKTFKKAVARRRRVLAAQHISAALLVSYLVLPPVAMKHFQALDCIPFNHDGSSYLRVDTAIDCDSSSYQAFRTAVLLFLVLYQSVPVLWFVMLHKQRKRLNPATSKADPTLALFVRDQDRGIDSIRFL